MSRKMNGLLFLIVTGLLNGMVATELFGSFSIGWWCEVIPGCMICLYLEKRLFRKENDNEESKAYTKD